MKITIFLLVAFLIKLFLDLQNIDLISWLDGMALGIVIATLCFQIVRKRNDG